MNIFLTGASGNLGSVLAASLQTMGCAVVCAIHNQGTLRLNDGTPLAWSPSPLEATQAGDLIPLRCDITLPRLELSTESIDWLHSNIDIAIHASALTDFGRADREYQLVNCQGTRHVVDLICGSARPIPLIHVSTAYVAGLWEGCYFERHFDGDQEFGNAYEWSKFEAERYVRDAAVRGLKTAIVRPSVVVGTTADGQIRDFRHLYPLIRLIGEGKVRTLGGRYDACIDLVPVDHVVRVIHSVIDRIDECVGRTFHAVSAKPLTLRDMSDVLAEFPSMCVPRILPPASFDESRLDPLERLYYQRLVSLYNSYFVRSVEFDSTNSRDLCGQLSLPEPQEMFRRCIRYGQSRGYFGPAFVDQEGSWTNAQR